MNLYSTERSGRDMKKLLSHFKSVKNGTYTCNYCPPIVKFERSNEELMLSHMKMLHPAQARDIVHSFAPNEDSFNPTNVKQLIKEDVVQGHTVPNVNDQRDFGNNFTDDALYGTAKPGNTSEPIKEDSDDGLIDIPTYFYNDLDEFESYSAAQTYPEPAPNKNQDGISAARDSSNDMAGFLSVIKPMLKKMKSVPMTQAMRDEAQARAEEKWERNLKKEYRLVQQFTTLNKLNDYRNDQGFNICSQQQGTKYRCKTYKLTNCQCAAKSFPNLNFYQKGEHNRHCPYSELPRDRLRARSCMPTITKNVLQRGRSKTPDRPAADDNTADQFCPVRLWPKDGKLRELVTNTKITTKQRQWLEHIRNRHQLELEILANCKFAFYKGNVRLDCTLAKYDFTFTVTNASDGDQPMKSSEQWDICDWNKMVMMLDTKCKSLVSIDTGIRRRKRPYFVAFSN